MWNAVRFISTKRILAVGLAFAIKTGSAMAGFLLSVLLARLLGASGIGIYYLAVTVVSICAMATRLGLDLVVLRIASTAISRGDDRELAGIFRQSTLLVAASAAAGALMLWTAAPFIYAHIDGSEAFHRLLRLMIMAIPFMALAHLISEYFKAFGSAALATFFQYLLQPMLLSFAALALLLGPGGVVEDIGAIFTSSWLLILCAALLLLLRRFPMLLGSGRIDTRALLTASIPLMGISSLNLLMAWTDTLVLGYWVPSADVGIYGVAARLAGFLGFVLYAFNSVNGPRFAVLHRNGDTAGLNQLVRLNNIGVIIAAMPIILPLWIFPDELLGVFGPEFLGAAELLRVLLIGQAVSLAAGSVGFLLAMTGNERPLLYSTLAAVVINVLGNMILIPYLGTMGAALSTAASWTILIVLQIIQVQKRLGISPLGWSAGRRTIGANAPTSQPNDRPCKRAAAD